ncbi:MAG: tRNA (guanosine(46)-N7)-methyltransferase TrmB [Chromatiaceae bacterium]|nr:MAG: tRNA (guanosine(46)-N7)-methyltransferase TrmB [Chromatiaceae bacterium]
MPLASAADQGTQTGTDSGANPGSSSRSQSGLRPIRSFVLREGRLTTAQARACRELWPRYGVDWQPGVRLDLPALFQHGFQHGTGDCPRPVVLEIGFGNGEALAELAATQPGQDFLGIEVHRPGVGHLLLEAARRELTNLRVLRADATQVLADGLAAASLAQVNLFFPDPWPKTRHHKRRIVQPAFVATLAQVLAPGGHFHAVTDWAPYAEHMLAVLEAASDDFVNVTGRGAFAPRPPTRPLTRFERRGTGRGHRVFDLIYQRR